LSTSIEGAGLSVGLYNKLKRKGINDITKIPTFDYNKLTKKEIIELLDWIFRLRCLTNSRYK